MSCPRRLTLALASLVLASGGGAAAAPGKSHVRATAGHTTTVTIGPGPVTAALSSHGYRLDLRLRPNRATVAGTIALALTRHGRPVSGARVRLTFTMLDMNMGGLTGLLRQTAPGRYGHTAPVLGMSGRWGLRLTVLPAHAKPFSVDLVDRMGA